MSDPQFVVIEQRISAGNDWNGALPSTTPDFSAKGVKAFPEDAVGGLFQWAFTSYFLKEVQEIRVNFNGVANKSIVIRKTGAPDILIFSSTNPLESNILITDKFQLAPDEDLVIVSAGAATAMYARVIARPLHPEPASALS